MTIYKLKQKWTTKMAQENDGFKMTSCQDIPKWHDYRTFQNEIRKWQSMWQFQNDNFKMTISKWQFQKDH